MPSPVADRLLSYYPALPPEPHDELEPPIRGITDAQLFDQADTVLGDLELNAARRLMCDAYVRANTTCYSFRWDAVSTLVSGNPREGVRHSSELGPVFQNIQGDGFLSGENPFEGKDESYFRLTEVVGLMWAGFITNLDPNVGLRRKGVRDPWPEYTVDRPRSIVFNETGPYWVEPDTRRREATDYINSIQHSLLDK